MRAGFWWGGLLFGLLAMGLAAIILTDGGTRWPGPEPTRQEVAIGDDSLVVARPVKFKNLTIFPVLSKTPKTEDRYITLDEGLKTGLVEVREMGASPDNPAPDNAAANAGGNEPPGQPNTTDLPNTPNLSNAPAAEPQNESGIAQPPATAAASALDEAPSVELVDPSTPVGLQELLGNALNPPQQQLELGYGQMAGQSAGNQVNRLLVINRSDRPLYLMPGEIILGGSQDRTIGRELVIAPSKTPVPIDVFCVEHGRWRQRGQENVDLLMSAQASGANAHSLAIDNSQSLEQAAQQADQGKFIASVGNLSKSARLAVQDTKNQQEVWSKISEENAKAGVTIETGAFTGNYVEKAAVERLEQYLANLLSAPDAHENVVGVIVAVNGKPEAMDVFESTPLFKKLWPKLLKSYALDAANAADQSGAAKLCALADAAAFLTAAASGEVEESEVKDGLALTKRTEKNVVMFSAHGGYASIDLSSAEAPAPAKPVAGAVHTSAYAK